MNRKVIALAATSVLIGGGVSAALAASGAHAAPNPQNAGSSTVLVPTRATLDGLPEHVEIPGPAYPADEWREVTPAEQAELEEAGKHAVDLAVDGDATGVSITAAR